MDLNSIASAAIFPSIGIARVGDSPTEFFIGPEAPGLVAVPGDGMYKDAQGRIKRQAARFRIFAFDREHKLLGEIVPTDATITWTVELANTKSAFKEFQSRFNTNERKDRNPEIKGEQRAQLRITPGPRHIAGTNEGPVNFNTGQYKNAVVPLGELRTDSQGRLLILGGFGFSHSPSNQPITHYANNHDWHDDVSDGPVRATIDLSGGRTLSAQAAHVIIAPPDFAPGINSAVTLHDAMRDTAIRNEMLKPPDRCNFETDILPIFQRAVGYTWVNMFALNGHGGGYHGDFLNEKVLAVLRDSSEQARPLRASVFARFRDPDADAARAVAQADEFHMPQLFGDGGNPEPGTSGQGNPQLWLTVTRTQFGLLRAWAEGKFVNEPAPKPVPLDEIPLEDQPFALTRAALDACVGGAFYPGIEMTYIVRDAETFSEPFRLSEKFAKPGAVTQWMACPWQADFYECNTQWWPAQRPDDIITEEAYNRAVAEYNAAASYESGPGRESFRSMLMGRERWDRSVATDDQFVYSWREMGFVVERKTAWGEAIFIETEREPYAGYNEREYFYQLLNIDRFPAFIPKARAIAERFLADARAWMTSSGCEPEHEPFEYTPEALDARLQQIYVMLEQQRTSYDPSNDPVYRRREDYIYRLKQMAPFNQLDGAWLRNVTQAGPTDEVASRLFSVWRDEVGDGDPRLNHCNLYTDLLHSIGVYPPANIRSRDYAYWAEFLDEAFTVSVMQLAISQFSEDYYPEILGLTLQLEWEVLSLWPGVLRMRYFGMDPHFYTMHIGIDNASEGHGAKAKEAVQIYLDNVARSEGPGAMQRAWQRIWTGYVTFAITGTIDQATRAAIHARHKRSKDEKKALQAQLEDLIRAKLPIGQHNHGTKRLGENYINDLFKDPAGFLQSLVQSGMIIPGDPDHSPFFGRTSFDGPMYKVFSETELDLWRRWILAPEHVGPDDDNANADLEDEDTRRREAVAQARKDFPLLLAAIGELSQRQHGEPMHHVIKFGLPGGPLRSVTEWLASGDPIGFLKALRHPDNGLINPGYPIESPFVMERLSEDTPMGRAWATSAPNANGRTWREIVATWVFGGCPLPSDKAVEKYALSELRAEVATGSVGLEPIQGVPTRRVLSSLPSRRRKIRGMEMVH